MSNSYHPRKPRARVRHRVKELLVALPVDTSEAKRVLRESTGINYLKLKRLLDDPYYHISAMELIKLADFFCVSANEIVSDGATIPELVKQIMMNSEPIRSLRTEHAL